MLFLIPVYLFLTALPLATSIGANLEYEYALLVGWLSLILIPIAAILMPSQCLPRSDGRFYAAPALELFWIFLIGPAIALLSPLYMFLADLCPCSGSGFGFWMVIMVVPAWVLGHAMFWGGLRLRVHGVSRLYLALMLIILVVAMVSFDGLSLWFNPQKRIVSLFGGFLHGPVYDDLIAVDDGIALARLSHFLLATTLLLLVWWQGQKVLIVGALLVGIGWFSSGIIAGRYPSTSLGKPVLEKLLAGKIEGDGFTLHYLRTKATKTSKTTTHPMRYLRLARDTTFHIQELRKSLAAKSYPHIEVFVYPDEHSKKLWFGGGSTDVADVKTPSIHIDDNSWPHPTLRHELVHALASDIGFHGLGFHPNMAFTEGLAVALAPDGRSMSLDDGAASVIDSGRISSVEGLFSPLFWQVSGGRAYTVAGSFINYLIDTSGAGKVTALYAGESFAKVLGQNRDKVLQEWKTHILSKFDKERHAVFSEALFRYPGLFGDQCPHSKVDLERSRNADIYVRLRQPLKWDPGQDYLNWRTDLDPGDHDNRLRVWRKAISAVASERQPSIGRLETWKETLKAFRKVPPKTLEDVEAGILESDIARVLGQTEESLTILRELVEAAKKSFFGFSFQREISARLMIEEQLSVEAGLEWRRLLAGWRRQMPDEQLFSGPWITTYLKLRNIKASKITKEELLEVFALDIEKEGLVTTFKHEWFKIIAGKLMTAGEFEKAGEAYLQAQKFAEGSLSELMGEHVRRAQFYKTQGSIMTAEEPVAEGVFPAEN